MTRPCTVSAIAAALLLTLPVGAALAQTAAPAAETGAQAAASRAEIDPFADKLIAATAAYLASAERVRVHAEVAVERVLDSGHKIEQSRQVMVMLRRPDRLYAEVLTDDGRRRFYYDGDTLSMQHLDRNVFAELDVGSDVDTMVDDLRARFDIPMPMADLLVSDMYQNFEERVDTASYVGLHYLNGVKHHHLLLSNEELDYQVWIEDGATPLPRKIVTTYVDDPGMPRVTTLISRWEFDVRMPDLVFEFHPPADADEIQVLPTSATPARQE